MLWVDNIVGKGENAGYQHFLLYLLCIQKATFPGILNIEIVWSRLNLEFYSEELTWLNCDFEMLTFRMVCKYESNTDLKFSSATDDIPHADETRTIIKDIWDIRVAKLRSSIDTFVKSDATHAKVIVIVI